MADVASYEYSRSSISVFTVCSIFLDRIHTEIALFYSLARNYRFDEAARVITPTCLGSSHTPRTYIIVLLRKCPKTCPSVCLFVCLFACFILNIVLVFFGSLVDEGLASAAALRTYSYVLLECVHEYTIPFTIHIRKKIGRKYRHLINERKRTKDIRRNEMVSVFRIGRAEKKRNTEKRKAR